MSDTNSLTQLVGFIGQSAAPPQGAANGIAGNLARKPHRRVGDLLGVVLALSARTRRMVMPQVGIDLDVFRPGGARAVRIVMGARRP